MQDATVYNTPVGNTTTTTYPLSPQQSAILDWARTGTGHLNVVARAGCGKTTTLLHLAELLNRELLRGPYDSAWIGAYNTAIANELKEKLTARGIQWKKVSASTVHSAGYTAWRKVAPDAAIDDKKLAHLFDGRERTDEQLARVKPFREFILKACGLAKQRAIGVTCQIGDKSKWFDLIDHFGLVDLLDDPNANAWYEEYRERGGTGDGVDTDTDPIEFALAQAQSLYRESLAKCREVIDYDDMILAPLYHGSRIWQHKWVMIDEAQDTNPARRALALRMLAPGGRLIAVGDPAQAIYGFTGADSDSMDQIKDKLRSATLPLNCTYRCPKQVVALAREWVPDITAHETAPEGVVRSIMYELPDNEDDSYDEEDNYTNRYLFDGRERLSPSDVILCRNTAPLVDCAYRLLRSGIGCYVEGRNIGAGLVKLIRRQKRVKLLSTLVPHIKEYAETEIAKLMAREREVEASNLDDAVQTVVLLADKLMAEGKDRVDDLVEFIEHLFGDTPDGKRPNVLTLATIHKAKGREWDRVYLLGRSKLMPSKWARQPWQVEQEDNLCYVAVTRAKRELVEVVLLDKKRKG